MDFIEICRNFISIDTSPSAGTRHLAEFAAELASEFGFQAELQFETLAGVEQANLLVRHSPLRANQELLLQTHLDTCEPDHFPLWSVTNSNPFGATIYQDAMYGLGTADVKLDFVCKLMAMREFKDKKFKLPPVLVGTFGEELGMAGAIRLIRKKRIQTKHALVGAPTDMRIIHAGKGLAAVEIHVPFTREELDFREHHNSAENTSTQSKIFTGRSAHASDPEVGESAIQKLFAYLSKLPDGIMIMEIEGGISFNTVPSQAVLELDMFGGLQDTIAKKLLKIVGAISQIETDFVRFPDASFSPPTSTLNIGMMRTLDDSVKLSGCCRIPPIVTTETYEGWMETLRRTCESVGASFHITDYKQPFRAAADSDLLKTCQRQLESQGLASECLTQSAANEANVFSRFGIECIVIGPGKGLGNSHAPNEHVRIPQLHEAIEFYKGIIGKECL